MVRDGIYDERRDAMLMRIVVVEKPFVPTHQEAAELVALARVRGALLTVYQSSCFLSLFSAPPLAPPETPSCFPIYLRN